MCIHAHMHTEREREKNTQGHTQCQGAQMKTKNKGITLANDKKPHQMSNVGLQDILNKEAKF